MPAMDELTAKLVDLVEVVVTPLIEVPDDLEVNGAAEGDTVRIEITVNEEDAGKVIGRQGRVIKAIRTLARAAALQDGANIEVELLD